MRFFKTRALAQAFAETGHLRLNGRRVERSAQAVAAGDVLVLPLAGGVRVIEILALPARRGPAAEAQACYRTLDAAPANPIAATTTASAIAAKAFTPESGRPTKSGDQLS
jgi:ribosome-associated heat shock protein Hsp15